MRRTRKQFAAELERDEILCTLCDGAGYFDGSIFRCHRCEGEGHLTAEQWQAEKTRMLETYDDRELAERVISRHEGGRRSRKQNRMSDELRGWIREHVLEDLESAYRGYYERLAFAGAYCSHVHHPCTTVGMLREFVDAYCAQPDEWRYATRKQQSSWCRSLLESMARAGEIESVIGESSTGRQARVYEPNQEMRDQLRAAARELAARI
jgi:hypothetical protein